MQQSTLGKCMRQSQSRLLRLARRLIKFRSFLIHLNHLLSRILNDGSHAISLPGIVSSLPLHFKLYNLSDGRSSLQNCHVGPNGMAPINIRNHLIEHYVTVKSTITTNFAIGKSQFNIPFLAIQIDIVIAKSPSMKFIHYNKTHILWLPFMTALSHKIPKYNCRWTEGKEGWSARWLGLVITDESLRTRVIWIYIRWWGRTKGQNLRSP